MAMREYKQVGQLVMTHSADGDYSSIATNVYACPDCGSVVWDTDLHDKMHLTAMLGIGF